MRGKIAVGAKRELRGDLRHRELCRQQQVSDSDGSGTELVDILDTIEKQQYVSPDLLTEHFWNVFVVDALLGNFDWHNANWGFLFDDRTGETSLAPIYDCGSCLLPQADEKIMEQVLSNEGALNARIYQFPTAAIKQSGKKINYYDFLMTNESADCSEAVKRIVPRVDIEKISAFLNKTPYISERQREFYKCYITARLEKILQPAFELAMSNQAIEMQQSLGF